jgi:hypothetical protein
MNPIPVPKASSSERPTGRFEAKASWRDRIMQFTTMSATNAPSCLCTTGTMASRLMSATVTNVAMIRMNVGIRTSPGMSFLMTETMRLEPVSTKNVAMPIHRLFSTVLVTARAGQRPSI